MVDLVVTVAELVKMAISYFKSRRAKSDSCDP
jgi:hypothetical protein